MKNLALCSLLAGGMLAFSHSASAQVKINLDINIGSQPLWGPTGYDHAQYYYLPECDAYYDVPNKKYVYWSGNKRVAAATLPSRYHVDVYKTYKVVMNEDKPWNHHDADKRKYASDRGRHDQGAIRDSHEEKYWQVKGHPDHNKWKGNGHDDHGKGHDDHGKGHDDHDKGHDDHGHH